MHSLPRYSRSSFYPLWSQRETGRSSTLRVRQDSSLHPTWQSMVPRRRSFSHSQRRFGPKTSTGVRVRALCPGPVDTAFFKVLGSEEPASVGRRDTAENTVKTAPSALDQGRSCVISGGPMNYWLSQSGRLVSRSTLARTSEKILRPTAETSRA
jgi:hypothetical protein